MRKFRFRRGLWLWLAGSLVLACGGEDPTEPPETVVIDSDRALVDALAAAYRALDPAAYEALLANTPEANAVFTFTVTGVGGSTHSVWDLATETSIHRRMFRPDDVRATDPPVDPDLRVAWVVVTLSPQEAFEERHDLYSSASNPRGFDASRWRITSTAYQTELHLELIDDNWLAVNQGDSEFTVIEDRTKDVGDASKFQLLAWTEICAVNAVQSRECWSVIKSRYAK